MSSSSARDTGLSRRFYRTNDLPDTRYCCRRCTNKPGWYRNDPYILRQRKQKKNAKKLEPRTKEILCVFLSYKVTFSRVEVILGKNE